MSAGLEPELSVVLPCRDQADHIGPLLESYLAKLSDWSDSFELVVVPNASRDNTSEVVDSVAQKSQHVVAVENPEGGWGRSVLFGLRAARGRLLCYTNTARTQPEWVIQLYELYQKHQAGLAKARRLERAAPLRELGSAVYNFEARVLFGITHGDVNGTPKLMSRELYERVDLRCEDDLIDMELMAKLTRLKVPVVQYPVRGFQRHGGRSKTNLASGYRMYLGALKLRQQLRGWTEKVLDAS